MVPPASVPPSVPELLILTIESPMSRLDALMYLKAAGRRRECLAPSLRCKPQRDDHRQKHRTLVSHLFLPAISVSRIGITDILLKLSNVELIFNHLTRQYCECSPRSS